MFKYCQTRGNAGRAGASAAAAQAWNPDLLSSFTFLMAGHGRSVSAAMMIGDLAYAQLQLAIAHGLNDEPLRRIVQEMEDGVVCGAQSPAAGVSLIHRFAIPYRMQHLPGG